MGKFKMPIANTSTVKSVRFPDKVLDKVENAIKGQDCTFNAFVVEAVKTALDDLGLNK